MRQRSKYPLSKAEAEVSVHRPLYFSSLVREGKREQSERKRESKKRWVGGGKVSKASQIKN